MAVKTQGTELYFVDTSDTPTAVKLKCPTGITGLGGAAGQIDTTCLDNTEDSTFVRGLGQPGQVSVPFNLDPADASHQVLFDLKAAGDNLSWLALLSDGTGSPTLDSDDQLEPPVGRSSLGFTGYIADVTIDIATNEIVRGTLTIQRSGAITTTWKS